MPRKNVVAKAAAVETPTGVLKKWDAEGVDLKTQIARASSSLSWYRRALKAKGLKAQTRETYAAQVVRYEELLSTLQAARDAAKKGAS